MTFADRVAAVGAFGFTERQARFLVTVMLHAGVCLGRQYCAFAPIQYGRRETSSRPSSREDLRRRRRLHTVA